MARESRAAKTCSVLRRHTTMQTHIHALVMLSYLTGLGGQSTTPTPWTAARSLAIVVSKRFEIVLGGRYPIGMSRSRLAVCAMCSGKIGEEEPAKD